MTPAELADIIADKCTDAIIEAPEEKHTNDIIRDTCCLVELLEVVEAANNLVNNCATELDADCCEQNTRNAITALRAKLPPHFHSTSGGKNE